MDKRPRRSTTNKKSEFNEGLLWQEERELTRALYASLQRPRSEQDIADEQLQQDNLELESKESENQGSEIPLDLPQADLQLGVEPQFVESPATCTDSSTEPLLLSEPQRLTGITEQQSILEVVGHSVVDNSVVDHPVIVHPIVDESVEEHSVLAQAVNHTAVNHALVDIVRPEEPLNITDPDHNDIQATEAFHELNSAIVHPQPEECPVKKRSPKSRDPAKPKSSPKRKDNSVVKDSSKSNKLPKVERSPKVQKSSKPKGLSRSKVSVETKQSHKKKVISGKIKSSKISSSKVVSTRTSKPGLPKPIITRSRSPKTSSPGPGLLGIKSKEVSKESSESIAHRLRTSVSASSGSAMGNVLGRPLRSQERKQNAEANAVNKDCADENKNSGDFLPPPPPPPLPPPLLPPKKHKSNAVALSKQSLTKHKERKCFAVGRERSSAKANRVPSVHGKNPKLKSIPKQPLRSLRRDLRSRSKFKMPQAEPATGPATRRRSTRSLNTSSSSLSSGASSNTDSQDETKSTTSSTSSVTRRPIARKAKERLVVKRKSTAATVSSTSGEEDDTKASKPKKAKVQAQRKFAYPQAYSPGCTPSKMKNGDMMSSNKSCSIFNHCPSTEDFLTFLCLRGTPALPPSLDLFKVQSKPIPNLLQPMPKQLAGRKRSASSTLRSDSDINIPGIEPLPREDSAPSTPTPTPPRGTKTSPPRRAKTTAMASATLMQQKMNIRDRRRRLDARQFKASGKISKNLRNSFKSNQNNIVGHGPQQLPPSLSPVPPPILAIQRSRHPPPLIPIVPWENKRCQTNNHLSSRNAAQMTGRKSSSVRNNLTRSSGRSSSRNCVPSKNNIVNHRLDKDLQEDQSPIIATSKAKNSSRRKETQKNNHKNSERRSRISQRLKKERCSGEVINGSNHLLDKLDDPPNGHTLLSQIKLLKGSRRERKEKKCSCHSQNCSQRTRSRHKNGDRELALEGAIEEVLKTAKRQKKLKELKRRSSRKLRNSSMMLRDRVQAAEMELDDSTIDKADTINNVLSTNGISKKLTIPLTNCTLNNNVLRKDSMICPKAHLNHEIEKKLTELKIKEDEEEEIAVVKPNKIRNPLLLKNHKELLPPKVTSETTLQKLQKKSQGQSPRRNRAKTKNGLAPFKSSKLEVPAKSGPSRFIEGVKEGLVLRPSAEEWSDPMAYMESIAEQLNEYGMCRVIPPDGWKPECKLHANTRFTTEVQYIHRLMHRWKSRSKQLACIKRHLEEREKVAYYPPQISGYEIDLVEFSQIVAQQGGLKTITNNKRWNKVADLLHIPKPLQSRVKLDSIYCKFLLSFDNLSKEEKQRLEMETELLRKQQGASRLRSHDHEFNSFEEVMCKGRPTTLSAYSRMASLTQQMLYTRPNPLLDNVEDDYWKMLDKGEPHVAVHTGQLNATLTASGFTTNRANPYAKHNWNCKNIGRNSLNILHLLPNHLGVNMPTMKIAMIFGSEGWSIDGQGLSQIEYLHTGSPKIWYGVPSSHCNKLEELLQSEVPDLCTYQQHCLYRNNLHCMVPPSVLSSKGVPVYRLVQEPGEFIIVADTAARANICTGYSMSEGIPCASINSLQHCIRAFEICQELKQSTLFSVEHLLCVLTTNAANMKTNPNLLRDLRTKLIHIRDRELSLRHQLASAGLKSSICFADSETCGDTQSLQTGSKSRNQHALDKGCHVCRQSCYLSMVVSEREDRVYCLNHAYQMITKTKMSGRNLKLLYRYSESQLRELVEGLTMVTSSRTNIATPSATQFTTAATTPSATQPTIVATTPLTTQPTTAATISSATQPTTAATTPSTTQPKSAATIASTSTGAESTLVTCSSSDLATTSTASPPSLLLRSTSPQLPPPPSSSSSSSSSSVSMAETTSVMSTVTSSSSLSTETTSVTTTTSSPLDSRLRKKVER